MQRLFLKLLWGKRCFNLQLLVFNSTFSFLWKQTKTEKEYSTPCAIKLSFYELWLYYSFFHNHVAFEIKGIIQVSLQSEHVPPVCESIQDLCWLRFSVIQVMEIQSTVSEATGHVSVSWRRFTSQPRGLVSFTSVVLCWRLGSHRVIFKPGQIKTELFSRHPISKTCPPIHLIGLSWYS